MPSSYESIEVKYDHKNGSYTPIAGAVVKIYKTSDGSLLATVVADANGIVPAGTVSVGAGTFIHCVAETDVHEPGYCEQVTT